MLAIFRLLVQKGPQGSSAGRIAERLNIIPATLSFHLKELSNAGLVRSHQEGRFVIYMTDFKQMNELVAFLTANCCAGNPCTSTVKCVPAGAEKQAEKA